MRITELAMKRPVTTAMIFLCFVVTGIFTARMLKLEFFPEIQMPVVFIQASYPNSTPQEIERLLTRPIEEAVSTMSGIKRIRSTSNADFAQVILFFNWVENTAIKGLEAREKIDAIRDQLPKDLRRIFVFTGSTNDMPVLQLRISSSKDLSNAYELLDRKLKRPLERIDGVAKVELYGLNKKEIDIDIDPERLLAHNIDINQLTAKLQNHNFTLSAGRITDFGQRYRVKPLGEFKSLEDLESLIIGPNQLRLSDIATINRQLPRLDVGRHLDRNFAIGLSVSREAGSNLVDVASQVIQAIGEAESSREFEGIKLYVMDNQAEGVTNSLKDISTSGIIGFILSVIVLFIFLRQIKTTLIVALAVPFSLSITLACMYFLDMTLNILSMMGLMLAIGMLVDNAVVITESIFRYQQQHPNDRLKATLLGVKEVGVAVFAGTITTAIVFLPNIIGKKVGLTVFLSQVAITICISLAASLFIALTVIPLMLSKSKQSQNNLESEGKWLVSLKSGYSRLIKWSQRHPKSMGLVCVAILFSIALPAKLVKMEGDQEQLKRSLYLSYNIKGQYQLEKVEEAVNHIEEFLYANKKELDIDYVYSFYTPNDAGSTVVLTDEDSATKTALEIREFIEKNMPEIAIGKPSFKRDFGGDKEGVSVQLVGESTQRLIELSDDVIKVMEQVPGLTNVRSSANSADRELQIRIDRVKASQLGVSTYDVASTVSSALRGQYLRTFRDRYGETDIKVKIFDENEVDIELLKKLPIAPERFSSLSLDSVASFTIKPALNTIVRTDRTTMLSVSADLKDGATMEDAKKGLELAMKQMKFPSAYRWQFGYGFSQRDEENEIMVTNMLLAIAMIYIVMAALFESMVLPTAVITSIIYSIVGVYWFFLITGTSMTVMGMIGILVLMGVVVNNGIVLIDHINHLRSQGVCRFEAVVQGGVDRLRPILMTVATTILGLIPLAVGDAAIGGNGPAYFPMARAIIGGLLFSTITTLILLPTIYIGLDNLRNWAMKSWREKSQLANRVVPN